MSTHKMDLGLNGARISALPTQRSAPALLREAPKGFSTAIFALFDSEPKHWGTRGVALSAEWSVLPTALARATRLDGSCRYE